MRNRLMNIPLKSLIKIFSFLFLPIFLFFLHSCSKSEKEGESDFLKSCSSFEDCQTGYCINYKNGKICTKFCETSDECEKDDLICATPNFVFDNKKICVPKEVTACSKCNFSDDCFGDSECVAVGKDGRFCLFHCDKDNKCPNGYFCQEMNVIGSEHSKFCYPVTMSCICTMDLLNKKRPCEISNEYGTCKGYETCVGEEGWANCDALVPAPEVCDGIDNNCDGITDPENLEGCEVYYRDADGDGFGGNESKCLCAPREDFSTKIFGDCDDNNENVNPQAKEVCDGLDNNCDGETDPPDTEGCTTFYLDNDNDGFGTIKKCLCDPKPPYTATKGGDCNDSNPDVNPNKVDICDGIDNNCNGQIDEDSTVPCNACGVNCFQHKIGKEGEEKFNPTPENSSGVTVDDEGNLTLDSSKVILTNIWIANSGENTISKFDTKTGHELGRYKVCSDPSRTAVDLEGNVYSGCRGDGGVLKIIGDPNLCPDKNGDGVIETSTDKNGNHKIDPDEMLPKGQDECIAWIVYPKGNSSGPRGFAVDKNNYPWVGYWGAKVLTKLDPKDGKVLKEITGLPAGSYGSVIDQNGVLWISGRTHNKLVKVEIDKDPPVIKAYTPPAGGTLYGIAVDPDGNIWCGYSNGSFIIKFDPKTEKFYKVAINPSLGYTRGIAVNSDGIVFVAHHTWSCSVGNSVTAIDSKTMQVLGVINTGGGVQGPVGVALDSDGYLWAINQCTSSATKIDPTTGQKIFTVKTGAYPYTYSDMTGYNLHVFTAPKGYYSFEVTGSTDMKIKVFWEELDVEAETPEGTYIKVRLKAAKFKDKLKETPWSNYIGPFPPKTFPLDLSQFDFLKEKNYISVEISLYSEKAGNVPKVSNVILKFSFE